MATKKEMRHHLSLTGEQEYTRGLERVTQNLKGVTSEQKLLDSQYDKSDESLGRLVQQQAVYEKKLESQKEKLRVIAQAMEKVNESGGKNSKLYQELARDYNYTQAAINDTQREMENLNKSMESAAARTENMKTRLKEMGITGENVGKTLDSMGSKLTKSLTLPIAGAAIGAGKLFMNFESEGMAFATLLNEEQRKNLDKYMEQALKVSDDVNQDAKDVMAAMYEAVSSDIHADAASKFAKDTAKAAKGGRANVETLADAGTSIVNAWGIAADEVITVYDKMLVAQDLGKASLEDIAGGIGEVTGLAPQLGVSVDEVLASVSSLTLQGVNASSAFTGMKAVFKGVLKPTEQARKEAKKLGLEFSAAALQSKGFAGFLKDVQEKTGGSETKLAKLFGSVEGLSQMLMLTTNAADSFNNTLDAMENSAGKTQEAFDIISSSKAEQLSSSLNKIKNNFITLGGNAAPALDVISGGIENVSEWLGNMNEEQTQSLIQWGAFALAVGPVTHGAGKLVTTFTTLQKGIRAVGSLVGGTGPLMVGVGVIGALIAGVVALNKHMETMTGSYKLKAAIENITIDEGKVEKTIEEAKKTLDIKDFEQLVTFKLNFRLEGLEPQQFIDDFFEGDEKLKRKDKKQFNTLVDEWLSPIFDTLTTSFTEKKAALDQLLSNGFISEEDYKAQLKVLTDASDGTADVLTKEKEAYVSYALELANQSTEVTQEQLDKLEELRQKIIKTGDDILEANNKAVQAGKKQYYLAKSGLGDKTTLSAAMLYLQGDRASQSNQAEAETDKTNDYVFDKVVEAEKNGDLAEKARLLKMIDDNDKKLEQTQSKIDEEYTAKVSEMLTAYFGKYQTELEKLQQVYNNDLILNELDELATAFEPENREKLSDKEDKALLDKLDEVYKKLIGGDAELAAHQEQELFGTGGLYDALQKANSEFLSDDKAFSEFFTAFSTAVESGMLEGLDLTKLTPELETMLNTFAKTIDGSKQLDPLVEDMKEAGKNSMAGLIAGLKDAKKQEELNSTIGAIAKGIPKTFNATMEIKSPSRVMKRASYHTIDGSIEGAKERASQLYKTYGNIYNRVKDIANKQPNLAGINILSSSNSRINQIAGSMVNNGQQAGGRNTGNMQNGAEIAQGAGGAGGNSININVTYSGSVSDRDARKLAQTLGSHLKKYM